MKTHLINWWRWIRRDGWELVDVKSTSYAGSMPTMMQPYFWETWQNKETGEKRVVTKT